MSDAAIILHENELALRPEEIAIDERYNIRRYAETDDNELKRVERLAKTIERDGQINAGVVVVNDKGGYTLTCGHRRRRAIILANEARGAAGSSLLKMRVIVDKSGGDPLRKAVIDNVQRQDLSAMDLATLIKRIREENQWAGFPGAKKVAEYLGIDTATVTQHERFLTADKHTQDALHSGEMSPGTAFIALTIKPEKAEEVFGKARQKQAEIDGRKKWADDNGAKKSEATIKLANGVDVPLISEQQQKTGKQADKLTAPAILAAIRDTPDATTKDVPRTRKEIISFFMSLDGPAYGFANGAVRQFVDYLVNSFCAGRGNEKVLLKRFDAMAAAADQGTESKRDKEPVEAKTTATGKLKRADAGHQKATKLAAKDITNWNQGPIEDGTEGGAKGAEKKIAKPAKKASKKPPAAKRAKKKATK